MNISNSSSLLLISKPNQGSGFTLRSAEYDVSPERKVSVGTSVLAESSPEVSQPSAHSRVETDSNEHLVDAGILGQRRRRHLDIFGVSRRSLQLQDQERANCAYPETCEREFCRCSIEGSAFSCAKEMDAVCKGVEADDGTTQNFSGCVPELYYTYYSTLYCDFASCALQGRSYAQCECEFYRNACDSFGDDPDYKDLKDIIHACRVKDCCFDNNGALDTSTCYAASDISVGDKDVSPVGDKDVPLNNENELQETLQSKTLLKEDLQPPNVEGEEGSLNKELLRPSPPESTSNANKEKILLVGSTLLVAWLLSSLGH